MKIAVLSASLNPDSKSETLARFVHTHLEEKSHDVTFISLKDHPLPFCDGATCYQDPEVKRINELLIPHDVIFVASPIYNYGIPAVLKNLIDLSEKAVWEKKKVALMVSAGGDRSYLAPLSMVNGLIGYFRADVTPRYVYATKDLYKEGAPSNELQERLIELISETL